MRDDAIILDWRDVNHESGRWADRWEYNLSLYAILHPTEDEILYLGKADGCTVRHRWGPMTSTTGCGDSSKKSVDCLSMASLSENSPCPLAYDLPANWFSNGPCMKRGETKQISSWRKTEPFVRSSFHFGHQNFLLASSTHLHLRRQ